MLPSKITKGKHSISNFESVLCNSIPAVIKNIETFDGFKTQIRKQKPINWPCQLYKNHIGTLGFVNISCS